MNYESVLVMDPALSPTDQKLFFQKAREVIKQFKGHIHHIDTWGIRKLANRNKKRWSQGLYFHFSFKGEVGVIEELIRIIKMDEKILYCHFEKLSSKKSPEEHLSSFRALMEEVVKKENDRLARIQKRKSFLMKRTGM